MADDDIIRRRLLIDGDGTGDDRRINVLLKTFIKWCMTDDETPEESQLTYERLLAQLAQCEFTMTKSRLAAAMNESCLKKYEELYTNIEKDIEDAKKQIEETKSKLAEAKRIRKNRMEYDALAKIIEKEPDREETGRKLAEVQKDFDNLKANMSKLQSKLELRSKQFYVLCKSIHNLQASLDSDAEEKLTETIQDGSGGSALLDDVSMDTT